MTLSRFLRDFLYIPLGGNRDGNLETARNLMITMVLGGLWHGAAWGFVLWGAHPRRRLVVERLLRGRIRAAALAALGDRLPRRRAWRGSCSARRDLELAGDVLLAAWSTRGPATLFARPWSWRSSA